MERVNLSVIYTFGTKVSGIPQIIAHETPFETWQKLYPVTLWMRLFVVELRGTPMPHTMEAAWNLLRFAEGIQVRMFSGMRELPEKHEPISVNEASQLQKMFSIFNTEFENEARDLNIFSVREIGTHSTTKLLENADLNLPDAVRKRLAPEVLADLKAAGRCLAFNTPTAVGFHILRAVEPLIREYHNQVTGVTLSVRSRNWGNYATRLRTHGGDPKVIGMIDHIREFYRNPIMHPEVTLTNDQAASLFYTCLSAIVQLDAAIQAHAAGAAVASPPLASPP